MTAAVIDFLGRIVRQDPSGLLDRDDWTTRVMVPAVDHLRAFQERTVERLELVLELVESADSAAVTRNWNSVIAAHHRLATPLRQFADYVKACRQRDIIDLAAKLRRFFELESGRPAGSGMDRALRPAVMHAIRDLAAGDREEAAATISAEILHMQLKWAILQNDCLCLQGTATGSSRPESQ